MIVPDTPRVPAPEAKAAIRWWESSVADGDLVAGVFEGGGAKGILYEGALKAMVDRARPRWFQAVAGSSAGAITALLVAAGLRPEDIARQTKAGVDTLRPGGRWAGLARLRSGRGYLSSAALADWLVQVLQEHLEPAADGTDAGRVTFAQLHHRTGIELHVVTVDLLTRRPMVFNYRKTPDEQVVPAVVASAAIPFVFDSYLSRASLLVDGGVSTNFPRFVFNDPSFRLEAGLDPVTAPVVGFLLDDSAAAAEGLGPAADPPGSRRRGPGWYLGRVLLLPLLVLVQWIPGLLRRNTTFEPPSYPRPKIGAARATLGILDGIIMFAVPPGIFVLIFLTLILVTVVGAYHVVWLHFAHTLTDLPASASAVFGWILEVVGFGAFSLIPVYALFIVLTMFTAGVHLWPTGRRIGYGLARTFLANPGAPSWAGLAPGDYVARLPVPRGLTTLASKLSDEETRCAQACAAAATAAVLDRLDNPSAG